jgi:hypothetical protein
VEVIHLTVPVVGSLGSKKRRCIVMHVENLNSSLLMLSREVGSYDGAVRLVSNLSVSCPVTLEGGDSEFTARS